MRSASAMSYVVHSTGRGGLGNMSRSRSRGGSPLASPSPSRNDSNTTAVHPQVYSSGRGGAGNIAPGPVSAYERGRTGAVEGIHSTGRGGLANLTSAPIPRRTRPCTSSARTRARAAAASAICPAQGSGGPLRGLLQSARRERAHASGGEGRDRGAVEPDAPAPPCAHAAAPWAAGDDIGGVSVALVGWRSM
ncbi:hypothetical protein C8R44DRAFT_30936 [Mycena epipterygia]|nr:hypothetical protein C8R44DRAFT_30936 [Mycena epipterygia]